MSDDRNRGGKDSSARLDATVARARQDREQREKDYRARSLSMHPWVCGRCSREFTRVDLHLLTVHHKDHNHDNNPPDGSNWENLCIYCHDNEHSRYEDHLAAGAVSSPEPASTESATHRPLSGLADLLKQR